MLLPRRQRSRRRPRSGKERLTDRPCLASSTCFRPRPAPRKPFCSVSNDGPNPRDTPKILAALKAAGVHALFCQVGSMTVAHPELARAEVDGGNMVCDHTHAHPHRLADRPAQVIDDEIVRGQEEIERATGIKPMIFRSPEGSLSETVIDLAKRHGMSVYQWSIDTKDYERPPAAVIASRVLDHLSPGAIVLMHDGGGNRDRTVAALPIILRGLKARGYVAVLPSAVP